MERWRETRERRTPNSAWLRPLRPPETILGGNQQLIIRGHGNTVYSVAFDPTGRRLASGSSDYTVRVWDAATGAEIACLRGHENTVWSVAFDPTGRRLASGSWDDTVRVWDTVFGAEVACLRGLCGPEHKGDHGVWSVAFDPTGRRLASAWSDSTVRVWDAATGAEIACLRLHDDCFASFATVAFDPTGRRLVSDDRYETLLWDAESWECLEVLSTTDEGYATAEQVARAFAWRALTRGLETVIKPKAGQEAIAWYSPALRNISIHPSGRIWAGSAGNHLYLIRLEGS